MSILLFQAAPPVRARDPNRADVACFVGCVGLRPDFRVPDAVANWLADHGWPASGPRPASAADLLDVPVPIESWSIFDSLFAWDGRPLEGGAGTAGTALGAAVRSFFAEGGRSCFVVRVGDPWPLAAAVTDGPTVRGRERIRRVAALLPGFPGPVLSVPADPGSWRGVGWVLGLPEVSFVSLPDLPDAVGVPPSPPPEARLEPPGLEQFLECSAGDEEPALPGSVVARFRMSRCDLEGYRVWGRALDRVRDLLARNRQEAQVVAGVPLPLPGSPEEAALPMLLAELGAARPLDKEVLPASLASPLVQLAFPWVRTGGASILPEGLESPEGALLGVLARNTVARGAFRTAAGLPLVDVRDVAPSLRREQFWPGVVAAHPSSGGATVAERVSLLGRTPRGMRLLSDVTAAARPEQRPASVQRLVSTLRRAARRLGEELVFATSGEALWARVRTQMETLLLGLYHEGALRGASPAAAFRVRCDRTTMSQADLDAGRVIAEVQFAPAAPIERITVVLSLDTAGDLSPSSPSAAEVAR